MTHRNLLSMLALAATLAINPGCYRHDVRFITVAVPQMGSPECARLIQDVLSKTEGIKSSRPDLAKREILIEYDALKLAIRNVEYVIAGAGFDAGITKAPEELKAKLPAECR